MTGAGWRRRVLLKGSFPPLACLYLLLFGAFGMEAPFFPLFLQSRGRTATEIGVILSAGTAVRLSIGPIVGVLADRVGVRLTLGCAAVAAGIVGTSYLAAGSFAALLAVSMLHAGALSSLNPLSDALTLTASAREGFTYGAVRGVGSGSFVAATLLSGVAVAAFGLPSIVAAASVMVLLMVAPLSFLRSPAPAGPKGPALSGVVATVHHGWQPQAGDG